MMILQTGISSHVFLLAVLKVITATVSVFTLAALFRVVPNGLEFVRHSAGLDQQLKHKLVELEDALAEVRRANMNKGLFISTISHELRRLREEEKDRECEEVCVENQDAVRYGLHPQLLISVIDPSRSLSRSFFVTIAFYG